MIEKYSVAHINPRLGFMPSSRTKRETKPVRTQGFGASEHQTSVSNRPILPYHRPVIATRAWRNGRRSGLEKNLSARWETGDAEPLKVGETSLEWQSRAKPGEK
jgi:hypothetical protein